jgi:hypothetical protein
MSKDRMGKRTKHSSSVVLLRDLAPRNEVTGGTSKVLFGERREPAEDARKAVKLAKRNADAKAIKGGTLPPGSR